MGTSEADLQPSSLTTEQVQEMLDRLDSADVSAKEHPRRSKRTAFRSMEVEVRLIDGHGAVLGTAFQVVTRNLSAHGLAFLHRKMLSTDQRLRIRIPLLDDRHVVLLARVARCRYIGDMMHEIGVEFVSEGKTSKP